MNAQIATSYYRLLVVDDNRAIHEDFRKILAPDLELTQLDEIEADLFGKTIEISTRQDFIIDSAFQGKDGLSCVQNALAEGNPYALAFIDMRMPPGWNGIETIENIWKADPQLQIVICSAYSDHSWAEISQRLGNNDRLLILKKPFDNVEILQMAYAMSKKCALAREQRRWQQGTDNVHELNLIRSDRSSKLSSPLEEITESVNILQRSFEVLKDQLAQCRNTLIDNTGPLSEATIQDLCKSTRLPELEQQIPDAFQRLRAALKAADPRKSESESNNSLDSAH